MSALLAELRGRIDVDLVAVVGALGDLLRRPHGLRMERLRGLVDMGPFELRLRGGGQGRQGEPSAAAIEAER